MIAVMFFVGLALNAQDTNNIDTYKVAFYSKDATGVFKEMSGNWFYHAFGLYIGSPLKTLISSKPGSNLLEIGTGIGLSLSWMIDGMDANSTITSVDNDSQLIEIFCC